MCSYRLSYSETIMTVSMVGLRGQKKESMKILGYPIGSSCYYCNLSSYFNLLKSNIILKIS